MNDLISRQAAIDALWKALYEYEDKTEKQFIDSEELDVADWIQHRNFVQNMSDIDRQTILGLPSAQPGWIPVTERLPEEEGLYLVAGDFPPGAEVHTRYFNVLYDRSIWSGTMTDKVKWWMPIPKPPEGAQDGAD